MINRPTFFLCTDDQISRQRIPYRIRGRHIHANSPKIACKKYIIYPQSKEWDMSIIKLNKICTIALVYNCYDLSINSYQRRHSFCSNHSCNRGTSLCTSQAETHLVLPIERCIPRVCAFRVTYPVIILSINYNLILQLLFFHLFFNYWFNMPLFSILRSILSLTHFSYISSYSGSPLFSSTYKLPTILLFYSTPVVF